ncbi:MAG: Do family serine endopeptidase [Acidobacteriota bacterium]
MSFRQWLGNHRTGAFLAVFAALALGILIGSVISRGVESAQKEKPAPLQFATDSQELSSVATELQKVFQRAAETIEPAVVNISTTSIIKVSSRGGMQHPEIPGFIPEELWRRFFGEPGGGDMPEQLKRQSLGSGVIVDPQGYVLTNFHVVAPTQDRSGNPRIADRIEVQLKDGEILQAEVIGMDPETDLAVLRIRPNKPLPAAKIGDSSKLQVGDWVIAVGSPFGYEQTVTAGIVSATKRVVPETMSFGDYIQTDAAINPGNSGGPLVNLRGEVVGINTFITTRTGQFAGLGFAIPSQVFINSYNQIITHGKIRRGWLGISMNTFPMTPELAKYFGVAGDDPAGIKDGDGVVVTQLIDEHGQPNDSVGPAAKAGIKPGDVIVKFGGKEIEDNWQLRMAVANTPPGEKVPVTIVRKGEVIETEVVLAERTLEEEQRAQREEYSFEEEETEPEKPKEIGLEFQTLTARDASELNLDEGTKGVLILNVTPGSLADDAGLARGMVITHVNDEPVTTAREFKDKVTAIPSGSPVIVRVIIVGPSGQQSIGYTSFIKP